MGRISWNEILKMERGLESARQNWQKAKFHEEDGTTNQAKLTNL
jgi:hypothetical protein